MRIKNENLLELDEVNLAPVNLTENWNSKAIWLGHISMYSVQLVFTGTPGGNFKLQCSNDPGHPQAASEAEREEGIVNWTDVADSALTVAAAGDITYNVEDVGYLWARVVWTNTGIDGELTSARVNVKGI